ncbi:hypothetical protein [Tahibacter caeni]|uniref:hypothetical protein n=1 Tax=Tahibacter caeni TaxID=1453545 RepID=UPI00214861C9|nr:hypothetical protein [Tahibacter caeni]
MSNYLSIDDRWQPGAGSRKDKVSHLGALLAGIAAFVSLFRVGIGAATDSLDGSWTAVLSWAFSEGAQFGKDIVFTYGPLGFLIPIANYHPQTFGLYFAAQVMLGVVWAMLVARFALRLPTIVQMALGLLLVCWAPIVIIDVGWYLMFVLAAVFAHEDAKKTQIGTQLFGFVALFALSVIALTKFTFLLLWLTFIGHQVLQLLLARRPVAAVLAGATAILLLLALWTAAGQNLSSLLPFFLYGLEISRSYGASMGYMPGLATDLAGLAILALAAVCVAPLLSRGESLARRALALFLLLTLALTWKAGYTRADAHVCIFFGAASLIAVVAAVLRRSATPRPGLGQPAAAGLASSAGLLLTYSLLGGVVPVLNNTWEFAGLSLRHLFNPDSVRRLYQAGWDSGARRFDLPATRERIGNESVDLLMHEQGVVLLNGFNYSPRPVFQGYGAYSTPLARLNESKLLGASAPRYLLFKLQAIDEHLPGMEDPLAQLAALRSYAPVGYEKSYLLLERTGSVPALEAPPAPAWREASFGEEIPVTQTAAQILFFRIELSLVGKLYAAFFREPAARLDVVDGEGAIHSYRVTRSLGDAGALVSPLLADNVDYLNWYSRQRELRPRSLRFVAQTPALQRLFAPRLSYALQVVELPRKDLSQLPESLHRSVFYPGFSHLPRNPRSPAAIEMIQNLGEDALFMHAPSSIEFLLPAGRWRAEGKFGLRADSYAAGVCPQADGTLLRAYRGAAPAGANSTLLFSRQIDPLHVEADRGAQPFALPPFDSDGKTPVTFEFSGGTAPSATTECDWTFIGPLRFEPEREAP